MTESTRPPPTGERRFAERRKLRDSTVGWLGETDRRVGERRTATVHVDTKQGVRPGGGTGNLGASGGAGAAYGGTTSWLDPSLALTRFAPQAIFSSDGSRRPTERVARYGFGVGELMFLLRAGTPSEVAAGMTIYPLPHTPSWLVGLISLRGNLVPAYDIALLLEREARPISQRLMLVLELGDRAMAFLVDGLPKPFREGAAKRLEQAPELPARLGAHVQQAFLHDDAVWLDFDHLGMVTALRQEIAAFA